MKETSGKMTLITSRLSPLCMIVTAMKRLGDVIYTMNKAVLTTLFTAEAVVTAR